MIRGESSIRNIKSYFAQGEWDRVIELCQQEIDSADDATSHQIINCYTYLARAYVQQGKIAQAMDAYTKILSSSNNQAEIYAELGLLHSKQKNPTQAVWHYREALKLKPDWAELQYNLGVILHQLGNWSEAIASYRQALAIKPDYAAAYFNLGVLYDQKGELQEAVTAYQQAIAIAPNLIRAYSNLGSTFARQQEYDQAIAFFKQGLALNPTWATLHNNLGQVYWFNRQPGLALESFETAIILDPKMSLAYHNLGRLWQQQGNYSQAIQCFERVIELEPHNLLAHSSYGDLQHRLGNLESTLDSWHTIIQHQPDFVDAYCQRKLASDPQDLLETAKLTCAQFLQALKQSQLAEAYHYLGKTYGYMGDVLFEFGGVKQAEVYYQRALQIELAPELYLKLGNCLARQNRLDAAMAIYQMGLSLEPEHAQICFQLGEILKRTQDQQAVGLDEAELNYELQQADDGKQLPKLLTSEDNSDLPSKIYHHTQDWVRDCSLTDFDYVQIAWHQQQAGTIQVKSARQSQIIKINPGSTSYPDCGGVNCNKCMGKLIQHFRPMQIGHNAFKCSLSQATPIQAGLPFVVTIPEGRAWVAPQKNSWVICNAIAVITPDNYLLGDLSRHYPWFLPGCPYQEKAEHAIYTQDIAPVTKIEGKVALLSGLAGHVYYHWMFDILPRLELLRLSEIELKDIDWFVVNSLSKPFQKETLSLLGIPPEKIIESDRQTHLQATELIVPSFPGYLDWVSPGTIKFLRQSFMSQVSMANTGGQKIYISRARAKNRHLVNESEVSELLTEQGFKTVFLEELSVLEQVAIFINAKIIVTPHGSGLTNLVFCAPNTKIVELFSPNYLRTDYWMISQQLQLQHYYLVGESFDCPSLRNLMYQNALTEDILVSIDALKLILQHLQQG
ncbi:MAG: tetratricopeptide repeat protein [Cyanobacteria bacterium P01_A01_bin.83]